MPSTRRFPAPWTIEKLNNACFVVIDANGQKLAYVYFEKSWGLLCSAISTVATTTLAAA
jgi:hypothetical protein